MTFEQGLLAAVTATVGGLCFLFNIIRLRSEECEKWRKEKEPIITDMAQKLGIAEGVATFVNSCSIDGCPFKGKLDASYSLTPEKESPPP